MIFYVAGLFVRAGRVRVVAVVWCIVVLLGIVFVGLSICEIQFGVCICGSVHVGLF